MSSQAPPKLFSYAKLGHALARTNPLHTSQNPIWNMVTSQLCERVQEVTHQFETAICLTPFSEPIRTQLQSCDNLHALHCITLAETAQHAAPNLDHLALQKDSTNAFIVPLTLSIANDLLGALIQSRQALRPDGLLLASLLGGETLKELRHVLVQTESAVSGGVHPRVHPFMDIRDAGNLLQRAGFNLPVIDRDVITITYPDMHALMQDLRVLGATNMQHQAATHFTKKAFFEKASAHYKQLFSNDDGTINATLELLHITAWKPADTQPKPLKRGSGKVSFKDAFE